MRATIGNTTSPISKWTRTPDGSSGNSSIQILAVESTTSHLSYINRDHKLAWCNNAFAKAVEFHRDKTEKLGIADLVGGTAYNHLKPLLEHAFRGNVTSFQFAVSEGDSVRHFSGTLTPEKPHDGVTQALVCQLNETTSANKIQQELFDRDLQLKLALTLSKTGICEIDLHSMSVFCDDRLKSIVGVDLIDDHNSKATLGTLIKYVHADDRERVSEYFQNAIMLKSARYDAEFRVTHQSDQSIRWIHATGQYLHSPLNQAGRVFFIVQDITRHKLEEVQAKDSRAKISHLLNHIPQLIWTTTANGDLIYANGRFPTSAGARARN